jgi:splicing factor 1
LYIPARDFPEVNFIGLLIGPRGNTLKKLETEAGVRISIRGKGSVKEGKMGNAPGEDEELHCMIMSDAEDKIQKAMDMINQIIETATSVPDGHNQLKKLQLRELAALNGTLREDEQSLDIESLNARNHEMLQIR